MSIRERAAAALVRAREAAIAVPATDPPHRRRLRAALTRDIATLLAVPADHILVGDDPLRSHGGVPGQLITVDDPDDPYGGLRFIPETGNTGIGGGALPAARHLPRLQRLTRTPTARCRWRRSPGSPISATTNTPCGWTSTRPRYPSSSSTTPPTDPTAPSEHPPPHHNTEYDAQE